MVRVVGKEGALGWGWGGLIGATAWTTRNIMRQYQLPGSVYYSGGWWVRRGRWAVRGAGGGVNWSYGMDG